MGNQAAHSTSPLADVTDVLEQQPIPPETVQRFRRACTFLRSMRPRCSKDNKDWDLTYDQFLASETKWFADAWTQTLFKDLSRLDEFLLHDVVTQFAFGAPTFSMFSHTPARERGWLTRELKQHSFTLQAPYCSISEPLAGWFESSWFTTSRDLVLQWMTYTALYALAEAGKTHYYKNLAQHLPLNQEKLDLTMSIMFTRHFLFHKAGGLFLEKSMLADCAARKLEPALFVCPTELALHVRSAESKHLRLVDTKPVDDYVARTQVTHPLHLNYVKSEWFWLPQDRWILDADASAYRCISLKTAFESSGLYDHKGEWTVTGKALLFKIIQQDSKSSVAVPNALDLILSTPLDFQACFSGALRQLKQEQLRQLNIPSLETKQQVESFLRSFRLDTPYFFFTCLKLGLPFPLRFLLFRPLIRIQTRAALMTAGGDVTGVGVMGACRFTCAPSQLAEYASVSVTTSYDLLLRNTEAVEYWPHVYASTYLGGAGTCIWNLNCDRELYAQNPCAKDLFCCAVPMSWDPSERVSIDMTGRYHPELVIDAKTAPLQYPTADIYASEWGWHHASGIHPFGQAASDSRQIDGRAFTFCWPGHYLVSEQRPAYSAFGSLSEFEFYASLRGQSLPK